MDAVDRYDVEAAGDAFAQAIRDQLPQGTFFRDATGIRWKYLAYTATGNKYIACHGEFGLVMTLTDLGNGEAKINTELKKIKQEIAP